MTTKTKPQHTPGPWHVGMRPGLIVYGPHGEQVADLRAGAVLGGDTYPDARLIAAAPMMAKKALFLLDRIERERKPGDLPWGEAEALKLEVLQALGRVGR